MTGIQWQSVQFGERFKIDKKKMAVAVALTASGSALGSGGSNLISAGANGVSGGALINGSNAVAPSVGAWSAQNHVVAGSANSALGSASRQGAKKMLPTEMLVRKVGNWFYEKKFADLIDANYELVKDLQPSDEDYMQTITALVRKMPNLSNVEFDINTETGRLSDIVASDEACIFVMNHDNQRNDPTVLAGFAMRLYTEYEAQGKLDKAPRPKVIVNEDILDSQSDKTRTIYEKLGAVGVDADLNNKKKNSASNARAMMSMVRDFSNDDNHIFIFPEGRLGGAKYLSLEKRFQTGVGDMINLALRKKDRVKVVPLGFSYQKGKGKDDDGTKNPSQGVIHIGEPVYIKRDDKKTFVSVGNATKELASKDYRGFFWNEYEDKFEPRSLKQRVFKRQEEPVLLEKPVSPPLTTFDGEQYQILADPEADGAPIKTRQTGPYISSVLIENMRICTEQAKETQETFDQEEAVVSI